VKKQTAVKLAIEAMTLAQKQYIVGHNEFLETGELFDWAKRDHLKWARLDTSKKVLRQMLYDSQQLTFVATNQPGQEANDGIA
jgi:hypothetical protein